MAISEGFDLSEANLAISLTSSCLREDASSNEV